MNHCNKLNFNDVLIWAFSISTYRATKIAQKKFFFGSVLKRFYVLLPQNHCPDICKAITSILGHFLRLLSYGSLT